ncbi:MAG: aminopeptidase [Litorilinea sp.]
MGDSLARYAELIIRTGINLQPGQSVRIGAELAHRGLVRQLAAHAYQAGARYVQVDWQDSLTIKQRLLHGKPDDLTFFPEYEVVRHQEMVDDGWARIALVGPEAPDAYDDVDPSAMRTANSARAKALKFYMQAMMANHQQWCVAGAVTPAWAAKVFPDLPAHEAEAQLWNVIYHTCRINTPDPVAAWSAHDRRLKAAVQFMTDHKIQGVRFVDRETDADGKPRTDLTVWLTAHPQWIGAAAATPAGITFFPNMPTEEIFSTPDANRTEGYAWLSKPAFPFEREVRNARFVFEKGQVVSYTAEVGQNVLDQYFEIEGTRRLGEVALVDVRSPVNQADVVFYETLYDENAACHIAFGQAYPDGVVNGNSLSEDELTALGVNKSDAHQDVMIGTASMDVIGLCANGDTVPVMNQGQFVDAIAAG